MRVYFHHAFKLGNVGFLVVRQYKIDTPKENWKRDLSNTTVDHGNPVQGILRIGISILLLKVHTDFEKHFFSLLGPSKCPEVLEESESRESDRCENVAIGHIAELCFDYYLENFLYKLIRKGVHSL